MPTTREVASEVDRLTDRYARLGRNAPDVAALVTLAVGFPCDIAVCDFDGDGDEFQVMTDHARDFWDWHLDNNEQFHATPARAAAHFIQQYRHWQTNVAKAATA